MFKVLLFKLKQTYGKWLSEYEDSKVQELQGNNSTPPDHAPLLQLLSFETKSTYDYLPEEHSVFYPYKKEAQPHKVKEFYKKEKTKGKKRKSTKKTS